MSSVFRVIDRRIKKFSIPVSDTTTQPSDF